MSSIDAYESIARSYRRKVWSLVEHIFKTGTERIADLGSGPAHNLIYGAQQGWVKEGLAIDISLEMLLRGRKAAEEVGQLSKIHFIAADVTKVPLRKESLDKALLIAVLHHLLTRKERLAALTELNRILRPGGIALITVWARYQRHFISKYLMNMLALRLGEKLWNITYCSKAGCRYYHMFSLSELKKDVQAAGFKILDYGQFIPPGNPNLPRKNYFVIGEKLNLH